jgi:hypothetical protein
VNARLVGQGAEVLLELLEERARRRFVLQCL